MSERAGRLGRVCMFQSATLKSYVLLPNTRMFLSECKSVYLHAVDVSTKSTREHAKQPALTVTDSCTDALVVVQKKKNVNALKT